MLRCDASSPALSETDPSPNISGPYWSYAYLPPAPIAIPMRSETSATATLPPCFAALGVTGGGVTGGGGPGVGCGPGPGAPCETGWPGRGGGVVGSGGGDGTV